MVSEKRCRKCRQVKTAEEFSIFEANKDGLSSYCRQCHGDLTKAFRDRNQKWIDTHNPKAQERSQRYRENHRELVRARKLAEYHMTKNDPVKVTRRAKYRELNRQRTRDRNNQRNAQLKVDVFNHYGGECFCCGENDFRFLTLDHVNNDGAAWRKQFASKISGSRLYHVVVELGYPDDFQLACWNCNCGRAYNAGICPHEEDRKSMLRLVS